MEKGNYSEDSNNGSLSFDFNYRLYRSLRVYTEFFLDDMESPVSLVLQNMPASNLTCIRISIRTRRS